MIILTFHPVSAITPKFSKFEKTVILSKIMFSFKLSPKRQVLIFNTLQQVCKASDLLLKNVARVDYTKWSSCNRHNWKIF